MILYNVTVNVDAEARDEWLKWMKETHVPEVLATGLFTEAKIARIMAEEAGGNAYSIQYFAENMDDYEKYEKEHATDLRREHEKMFGGRCAAFRTLLHIVHHDHGSS
ncbi:MAG TPA: DUF4286 family protein [Cryomorphaceae bacterium]|nr:DUF4286 family protein [Cryomorphaceae bacterium]